MEASSLRLAYLALKQAEHASEWMRDVETAAKLQAAWDVFEQEIKRARDPVSAA